MNPVISEGLAQQIKTYLLGKSQGDQAWFQEVVGEALSLKELLALVNEKFPAERGAVLRLMLGSGRERDPQAGERREAKRRALREMGDYGWDLPHGVPGGPGLGDYLPVKNYPATAKALEAVERWLTRSGTPILVLAGPPGTGKTHLATGAGQQLLDRNDEVLFRQESELLGEMFLCFKDNSLEDRLRAYRAVPWLILDDLGVSATNDTSRGLLDRVVNSRWEGAREGLRTLVTTNLLSKDLPPRVASRLADIYLALVVQISAPDHRQRRASAMAPRGRGEPGGV